jgi:four helix bundle protein
MKNFKELKIWQKGMDIANNVYILVKDFPKDEKFGLVSQITRAAVSIPSNIAEGSAKISDKDYARSVEIALGSAFELETQILISAFANFGKEELRNEILKDLSFEQSMIQKFIQTLRK